MGVVRSEGAGQGIEETGRRGAMAPHCVTSLYLFSALQNLNIHKMDSEEAKKKLKEAMEHMAFAVLMCLKQAKAGRLHGKPFY